MSEYINSTILALIQGATEYLPISSSAHLILLPNILGWNDQGLAFDIAVHVGTLFASIIYFRSDILRIITAWFRSLKGRYSDSNSRMGWYIIVASIPVAVAGATLNDWVESSLRNVTVIAGTTLIFGLLLYFSDRFRRGGRTLENLSWVDVILIGLSQAIAIIPGTSRSGITITMGLWLGLTRKEASKFAFLLAIPAISMAGGWQFLKLLQAETDTNWILFGYSTVLSGIVAYLCIHYFLRFIEKIGMLPFAIYRILLAVAIFSLAG